MKMSNNLIYILIALQPILLTKVFIDFWGAK